MKGDVELSRKDLARAITINVSVKKAARSLTWRLRVASVFFKLGAQIIGCNIKIEGENE